jgi:hypothetical protein
MSPLPAALRKASGSRGASLLCVLLLAACAETPKAPPTPVPVAVPEPPPQVVQPAAPQYSVLPGLTARQRVRRGVELLGEGRPGEARAEIQAFLAEQPDNELGRSLIEQIDGDPQMLLGAQSFPYRVQPGETLSALAERFLGDRFKFWVLARYNNIPVPARMDAGQQIMIPGLPRAAPPPRRQRQSDDAAIAQRLGRAAPGRDPARASQLRGNALELMSAGVIAQAVRLLEQALQLDPGNSLIVRDLDRARRLLRAP